MTRNPNVAGMFYDSNPERLRTSIQKLLEQAKARNNSKLVVTPHAGINYSGLCAAHSFKSLKESKTFVILGTNHNCIGSPIITDEENEWSTPLGTVKIDLDLKEKLRLETDGKPFDYEHSIEVQLPFLQILFPESRILPVLLNPGNFTMQDARNLSVKLKDSTVIASSDLTHYGTRFGHASNDDEEVIKEILELNSEKFYENRVKRTVCGWPCILTVLELAKLQNLKPELVNHYTSAEITRTPNDWVGYASVKFV